MRGVPGRPQVPYLRPQSAGENRPIPAALNSPRGTTLTGFVSGGILGGTANAAVGPRGFEPRHVPHTRPLSPMPLMAGTMPHMSGNVYRPPVLLQGRPPLLLAGPGRPHVLVGARPPLLLGARPPLLLGGGLRPVGLGMTAPGTIPLLNPRRELSPHAGSRAIAGLNRPDAVKKDGEASSSSRSSTPSSSSSKSRKKSSPARKRKRRRRRRRRSSSTSSSSESRQRSRSRGRGTASAGEDPPTVETNPEVDAAKKEALVKLQDLRKLEPKEARMKEWRSLLRAWHPDKNPDRTEVATAVFQFLQKGKLLLDMG
eukprot:TRINITY_DN20754_c0_g2_i1.p1 TRINITY_DN20754_c0_g2~~TRINITY_DN20754_c0_g2_i1.p1  ORF type:complete len:313 (-),score=36.41 TRINITY_DN20754_c0_g2_i1:170-1108(-)